jgi:hypothetical protein
MQAPRSLSAVQRDSLEASFICFRGITAFLESVESKLQPDERLTRISENWRQCASGNYSKRSQTSSLGLRIGNGAGLANESPRINGKDTVVWEREVESASEGPSVRRSSRQRRSAGRKKLDEPH